MRLIVDRNPGLLVERPSTCLTPLSMVNIGGPWSVKGLIANPIGSPNFWKPSTFGGEVGFNIIKQASMRNLFCNNMKDKKDCEKIKFTVPRGTPWVHIFVIRNIYNSGRNLYKCCNTSISLCI